MVEFEITGDIPTPRTARNRLGAARKHGKPPDVVEQCQRDLANAKLAKAIDDRVNSALGLTDAEAAVLAARLRPLFLAAPEDSGAE